MIEKLSEFLNSNCAHLNHLDKEVADGDLGIGVERGCNVILENINHFDFINSCSTSFKEMGNLIACHYGGTSGPLFASLLICGSDCLKEKEVENKFENWLKFYLSGTKMMQKIGKAELNDRTMMDVLLPFGDFLNNFSNDFNFDEFEKKAVEIMDELLKKIRNMKAKKGRTAYQDGKEIGKEDPGSYLVVLAIKFVISFLKKN